MQASELVTHFSKESSIEIGFLPINPRLPGVLRKLQALKYVRTVATSVLYVASLLFRVRKYDVIHVFSASYFSFILAPTPAILIGKLYGKKVLLNYHSGEAEDHLTRWRRTLIPTISLADALVVPSEYLVRVFAQFGLPARAIYNVIDLEKFRFRKREHLRPVFLSNRNLESHYGVGLVLRAFGIIQKKFPEASLRVAGDGSQRVALKHLAKSLELRNTVFVGKVDPSNIAEQYDEADVYLNGSEIDNQPLSLLEALASGLPIVTTNAGGIPDIVTDKKTGLLVERGDYRKMAEAAMLLLNDAALASAIQQQGLAECEKYTWNAVRHFWLAVYQELADVQTYAEDRVKRALRTERKSPNLKKSRLKRLLNTSMDELRVRGSQSLSALAERASWSRSGRLRSEESFRRLLDTSNLKGNDLFECFRSRTQPTFFASFEDRATTVSEFTRRWPQAKPRIVDQAERILSDRFNLLGFKDLSFGTPIDWHFEPIMGKRAPLLHWSRLNYLDSQVAGDKKIVWELNRHQHFAILGQAYWLTNDERYAEAFVTQIESWMDQNPPKLGINWASSLEVAFRSIAWLWALYFFKDSTALGSATFARILQFLYLHARHVETYLSTYFSPNTHLTGEALGLFYLGTFLPEFKEARRWRAAGLRILIEQLPIHVKTDGVYFEQSSYYHRYTTDFYTHLWLLLQANGQEPPSELREKLQLLLDHLMYISRPDGATPLFGDDDGGRLVTLEQRASDDFRAALSNGAAIFKRPDYKYVAGEIAEETFWLVGPKGVAILDTVEAVVPDRESVGFEHGGIYVMRDGWEQTSNFLLFDCGPHGINNCGHAHADALSFEVASNGQALLVDPGTYTYTGSQESRDWFRSSLAHNTLTVDGESSSLSDGTFSWQTIANSELGAWISQKRFDFVSASHDGYERLDDPVTHTRSILFIKNDYWIVRDSIESESDHLIQLWFHFNQSLTSVDSDLNEVRLSKGVNLPILQLITFSQGGEFTESPGWVSRCYGSKERAPALGYSVQSRGSTELVTFLLPHRAAEHELFRVRELQTSNGLAYEIGRGGKVDLLMIRDPRANSYQEIYGPQIASDFDLTWTRFAAEGGKTPEEVILIGGQTLALGGREILKSGKRIDYISISSLGDQVRFETEAGVFDSRFPIADFEAALLRKSDSERPN